MQRWNHRIQLLLHLKAVIAHLKAIEQQATLTLREREVVREHLDHAYDWAAALLPPMLLHAEAWAEEQYMGGTRHAAH